MMILQDKHIEVTSSGDIVELLRPWFKELDEVDSKKEYFIVIHLDTRNRIQVIEVVSIGILNGGLIHPREVFKRAVIQSACQIIVVHNHPSGVCDPSDEDIKITYGLKEAGKILGIEVIDHIIISETEHYSFRANGIMP